MLIPNVSPEMVRFLNQSLEFLENRETMKEIYFHDVMGADLDENQARIKAIHYARDMAQNSANLALHHVHEALQSPVFADLPEELRDYEKLKEVIERVYGLLEPTFGTGGGLPEWLSNSGTVGTTGVCEFLAEIDRIRREQDFPELKLEDRSCLVHGLFALTEGNPITPNQWPTILRYVNPEAGDLPRYPLQNSRLPRDRFASSNQELMPLLLSNQEGHKTMILAKAKQRGKTLPAAKINFLLDFGGTQLLEQDLEILITALKTAQKNKVPTGGGLESYLVTDEAIVKAYFPKMPKITPEALKTVLDALERCSRVSMTNVDLRQALKVGRINFAFKGASRNPLWTGIRVEIASKEKAGVRTADIRSEETKTLTGWRIDTWPLAFCLDESLERIRAVSRDIRPSIPYDPETEEIFIKLAKYLRAVAYSPAHVKSMNTEEFMTESMNKWDRYKARSRVKEILHYWTVNHVCSTAPDMTNLEEAQKLTIKEFSIHLPLKPNGRAFPNTPAGSQAAARQMKKLIETPWDENTIDQ